MLRSVILCGCLAGLTAADWYVSPAGSDANPGSQVSPWATMAKALSASAAGDRIYLARGGTWRGTFTIGGGRQLLAYGSGADPELTAAQQLTFTGTWGSNPNVRTVAVASPVLGVWVNGSFQRLARYPNKGASPEWLRVDAGTSAGSITDAQLPGRSAGRWTGAQVRWRRWSWWWETRAITADSGGSTLTLGANPVGMTWADGVGGNQLADGQGSSYFIDNDLDELDAPGEWFWGGGTLYVYPPAGSSPTTVEVATATTGIVSDGAQFTGIAFRRFQGDALTLNQSSIVDGCTFSDIEVSGIRGGWNAGGSQIRNSIFRDIRNCAVEWWSNGGGASGTVIERNLMHRIGVEHGYGGTGTWHACGVIIGNGNAVQMRLNRVVDVGYCGVILGTPGQTVHRNVFARTMQTLNDGAAIYTNCNASIITENIVLDTLGDLSTSHPWWPLGHGIWPEFLSDFHDQVITDNTIYGSNGNGVVMDNEYTSTVSRNVIVDCRSSGLVLDVELNTSGTNAYGTAESADNDLRAQNHTMQQNIIATVLPTRRISRPEWLNKWWVSPYSPPKPNLVSSYSPVDYGTMSGSTFITPATGSDVFIGSNPSASWTTLSAWSTANSSWAQNGDRLVAGNTYLLINDTESTATMSVPAGTWTLHDGTAVGATVSVPAFRSVVLLTAGSVPATPYTVASGIDWRAATPTNAVLGGSSLPVVSITASDSAAAEPANGGTWTITRSPTTASALTVQLSLSGSATSGSDFTAVPTSVTIPASQASVTVNLSPMDDAAIESSETVILGIAADAAYTIGAPASATVTIADDDSPPSVSILATDSAAGEPGNGGLFTVSRSYASASPLTVSLTAGGSATAGADFTALPATVTILANQTSATVSVTVNDDALVEASETVVLTVASGAGYTVGSPTSATVTIADNDASSGGGGGGGSKASGGGGGCGAGTGLAGLLALLASFSAPGWRRRDGCAARRAGADPRRG